MTLRTLRFQLSVSLSYLLSYVCCTIHDLIQYVFSGFNSMAILLLGSLLNRSEVIFLSLFLAFFSVLLNKIFLICEVRTEVTKPLLQENLIQFMAYSTEWIMWGLGPSCEPLQGSDASCLLSPEIRVRLWPCKLLERAANLKEDYSSVWGCSWKGANP